MSNKQHIGGGISFWIFDKSFWTGGQKFLDFGQKFLDSWPKVSGLWPKVSGLVAKSLWILAKSFWTGDIQKINCKKFSKTFLYTIPKIKNVWHALPDIFYLGYGI